MTHLNTQVPTLAFFENPKVSEFRRYEAETMRHSTEIPTVKRAKPNSLLLPRYDSSNDPSDTTGPYLSIFRKSEGKLIPPVQYGKDAPFYGDYNREKS